MALFDLYEYGPLMPLRAAPVLAAAQGALERAPIKPRDVEYVDRTKHLD